MQNNKSIEVIILAAGLGTRMRSDLPKVLHRVCREPMISLLMKSLDKALQKHSQAHFNVVVGHGRELVKNEVQKLIAAKKIKTPVSFTVQEQQLGTGHAVRLALDSRRNTSENTITAVFNGDLPLFSENDFDEFLEAHVKSKSVASLGSMVLENPEQYGRVLRSGKKFKRVIEFKDASAPQKKIKECNGGVYLFDRKTLLEALRSSSNKNASNEFYLPDVFSIASKKGKKILAHLFKDDYCLQGVNNLFELSQVQKMFYENTNRRHLLSGVFIHDPGNTYIGPDVTFGKGCQVGPLTSIHGNSKIDDHTTIGAGCEIRDSKIGARCEIKNGSLIDESEVGAECKIGPMAHLRPKSLLKDRVKLGNFVETKSSLLKDGATASHLAYIGDADIGENTNLGCGFITCNYDGLKKHKTVIHRDVFVGSDSQVIAPIEISEGTYVASGSTLSESVHEPYSLVIARTKQITKPGYAKKYARKK